MKRYTDDEFRSLLAAGEGEVTLGKTLALLAERALEPLERGGVLRAGLP